MRQELPPDLYPYLLQNKVVVSTTQTTVTGHAHQLHSLHRANLTQGGVHILSAHALVHTIQHLSEEHELEGGQMNEGMLYSCRLPKSCGYTVCAESANTSYDREQVRPIENSS